MHAPPPPPYAHGGLFSLQATNKLTFPSSAKSHLKTFPSATQAQASWRVAYVRPLLGAG